MSRDNVAEASGPLTTTVFKKRYPPEVLKGSRSEFVKGYRCAAGGLLARAFTAELLRRNYPADDADGETEFGRGVIEALADWELHK